MARKAFTERWEVTSKSVQGQTHGRIKSGYKDCKICCGHSFFLLFLFYKHPAWQITHRRLSEEKLRFKLGNTLILHIHAAIPFPSLAIVKTVPRPAPLEKRQETHRRRSSLERNAHHVLWKFLFTTLCSRKAKQTNKKEWLHKKGL